MREIPLTRGYVTLVDDEDYDMLMRWSWSAQGPKEGPGSKHIYAHRGGAVNKVKYHVLMHRALCGNPPGLTVDHRDRNTLNNQKSNLRVATIGQNTANKGPQPGWSSPFKGVSWYKRDAIWTAQISLGDRKVHLGRFTNDRDAAAAYNIAANAHHGEFACLNDLSQEAA